MRHLSDSLSEPFGVLQGALRGIVGLILAFGLLLALSLNEMIDAPTSRVAALNNTVPREVLLLELLGAAIELGLLAAFLAIVGRGLPGVLLASMLVHHDAKVLLCPRFALP